MFLLPLLVIQRANAQFGGLVDTAKKLAVAEGKKKITQQIGHVLGDNLPVVLNGADSFSHVAEPKGFHPQKINCTPQNMNTRLKPGDYTCEVRLYCQKDSDHAPAVGIAYELAPFKGPKSEALSTLAFRAAASNASPQDVQFSTWALEDGLPLNQLPPGQQAMVQKLVPDYAKEFQANPLQDLKNFYQQIPILPKLMPFEEAMRQIGEPGQQVLRLQQAQEALKKATLAADRQGENPIDYIPGARPVPPPATPEVSPWSEIRPGVLAQLTIEGGNLQLNRLNFRVLPRTGSKSAAINSPRLLTVSYGAQADLTLNDYVTIAEIFGSVVQPELAPELLADAAKRRLGKALIGYAINHGTQAMLMMMAQNGEGGGGGKEPEKEKTSEATNKSDRPFKLDDKQLGKKIAEHARDFGLNPADAGDREVLIDIIKDIGEHPDEVRSGTFAGQGGTAENPGARGPVEFRIKGTTVVVTKPDGTFVTILKDGTGSTSVKAGVPLRL